MKTKLKYLAAIGSMALVSAAHAAVDISAETDAAKADIEKNGTVIIGVVVAIAVIAWIRRIIK